MCTVPLPPGVNPIAVKYVYIYIIYYIYIYIITAVVGIVIIAALKRFITSTVVVSDVT
jgi:hypothetical protein